CSSDLFDPNAWANIQALTEMRDSSIHFYNRSGAFPVRLQEIGTASLKNFVAACKSWFGRDLSEFNFYLMPLSFIALPQRAEAVVLNHEEKKFLAFIESLEPDDDDGTSPYSVTVNIDIKFTRSKAKDALGVNITNNPSAPEVRLTEEQVRDIYPWDYERLTAECRKQYSDFKMVQDYHDLRKKLAADKRFGYLRLLDPNRPKGQKKPFFNPNIMQELDKHYTKK
ncbi:MAG: hypothetical protein RBT63_11135, partial [Bdellovibrionales bacterium]|nr:hypothetical protein [Bdellovibrionales bacterium]